MYISHIKIQGFRNFKNSDIEFNDGLNVLRIPHSQSKTIVLIDQSIPITELNTYN